MTVLGARAEKDEHLLDVGNRGDERGEGGYDSLKVGGHGCVATGIRQV